MKLRSSNKQVNKSDKNNNITTQVISSSAVNEDKTSTSRSKNRIDIVTKPCKVVLTDISKQNDRSVTLAKLQQKCGDGKNVKIFNCKSARCELKENFIARDKIVSSCTKRIYDCITPPNTVYLDCHDSNVIYCLTCSTCGLQYVGETSQRLNARFSGHRRGIKDPAKHGTCKYLSNHFNQGVCKGSNYTVQILEKLAGSGKTVRGAMDPSVTPYRKSREVHWMLKLRTVYPYGLNDRTGDEYMRDQNSNLVGLKFPTLKRTYHRINQRIRSKREKTLNHEAFLKKLDCLLKENLKECLNFIRISLSAMRKSELKRLGDLLNDKILELPSNFLFSQWYSVVLDIIDCKTLKNPPKKPSRTPPSNILHVDFKNKGIEMVNLSSILHSLDVKESLPSLAKSFTPPTVVYSLDNSISSKIFNFNKFTTSLNVQEFLNDPNILPCSCSDSLFSDQHHGHIISGDLRLIKNSKLRKIFSKGPKYRERKFINWDDAENSIVNGVNDCAQRWCQKNKKNEKVLKSWISTVTSKVKEKITWLKQNKKINRVKQVLKDQTCKDYLDMLHTKYVIVPIDKATGNIAFICKRFYASVLVKELGLDGIVGSETYECINNKSEKNIVKDQIKELSQRFKLQVPDDCHALPHIYWLPKLHKNPIKFRFIIAAPKCSVKPLSKAVTKIFRKFYQQIEEYNKKCSFFSSVKGFWVIQNNEEVIKSIKKINKRRSAQTMSTFDFSTLYTKIPHDKLIYVMNELVDFCFQGGTHEQLSLSNSTARWVSKNNKSGLRFDRKSTKLAIEYLMNNCFFTLGEKIFKQIIGIPMGSDPAPFMANLFLYYYESKWIKGLKKSDIQKARKFTHTFRFIDDLLTINNGDEFYNVMNEIYPPELQLNREHSGDNVSFLDLSITKCNGQFDMKLFDKRDDFPFAIVRMPFASSNMPKNMFYGSIGAEILRVGRVSSSIDNFRNSCKILISRSIKQGANKYNLEKTLKKIYGRQDILKQFSENALNFVSFYWNKEHLFSRESNKVTTVTKLFRLSIHFSRNIKYTS